MAGLSVQDGIHVRKGIEMEMSLLSSDSQQLRGGNPFMVAESIGTLGQDGNLDHGKILAPQVVMGT